MNNLDKLKALDAALTNLNHTQNWPYAPTETTDFSKRALDVAVNSREAIKWAIAEIERLTKIVEGV